MGFKSKAQQGYLESAAASGKIDPAVVAEYEKATTPSDYASMPDRVTPKKGGSKQASGPGDSHHGKLATHHARLGQHYVAQGKPELAKAYRNLAIAHASVAESEPADANVPPVAKRAKDGMTKRVAQSKESN